jgi:hypothetical protein
MTYLLLSSRLIAGIILSGLHGSIVDLKSLALALVESGIFNAFHLVVAGIGHVLWRCEGCAVKMQQLRSRELGVSSGRESCCLLVRR